MRNFEGKVAVITGAGRGIGRGIALKCAAMGMRVVLAGIGLESLDNTNNDLKKAGATTLVVQTDVQKASDVENLAQKTLNTFGEVNLLVNNAGVGVYKSVWESSLVDWEWVMGVNFWGVLYGVRSFLPKMIEQTAPGHIVNVSSVNGILCNAGIGSYNVSKHAVIALTETLYLELSSLAQHINVSVFLPGQVNTDIPDSERNRPKGLKNDPEKYVATDQEREWLDALRKQLNNGKSIEEAADILFKGIREENLYIGIQGFLDKHPNLVEAIQERTNKMINS